MMAGMIKWLHLLIVTTLFGLFIANYFYARLAFDSSSPLFKNYNQHFGVLLDKILLILILLGFLSGTLLVPLYSLSYTTPWILMAYLMLSLVLIIVLCNLRAKYKLSRQKKNHKPLYYLLNTLGVVIFIAIIHDAVSQTTFISYL